MNPFPATRSEALERLEEFLPQVPRYAAERNFVVPGHRHVSRLSAAVRHRLLTEEEIVHAVLQRHSFSSAEKFLQEVLWRGYWKAWLEARPGVWKSYQSSLERLRNSLEPDISRRAQSVANGESGAGFFDGLARELQQTGYLHNHARMWWASYWIHYCGLPWELGAQHFLDHLLDADPASNTLSWRWVAGLQTRGKVYIASEANIRRFAAPELLERAGGIGLDTCGTRKSPDYEEPPPASSPPEYPTRLSKIEAPCILLLHDEDLCLETGPARNVNPRQIIQYAPAETGNGNSPRRAWLECAREDAARRTKDHFGREVWLCKSAGELAESCQDANLVVGMAPFVGPLQETLAQFEKRLLAKGIRMIWLRRRWDARLQPFAQRGFFPFWEKARRWLAEPEFETSEF